MMPAVPSVTSTAQEESSASARSSNPEENRSDSPVWYQSQADFWSPMPVTVWPLNVPPSAISTAVLLTMPLLMCTPPLS